MTNTDRIPHGTKVQLPDGTEALAYYDGNGTTGTYRTAQPSGHGGTRVDCGWCREQLTVISECSCGVPGLPQCDMHGPRE